MLSHYFSYKKIKKKIICEKRLNSLRTALTCHPRGSKKAYTYVIQESILDRLQFEICRTKEGLHVKAETNKFIWMMV